MSKITLFIFVMTYCLCILNLDKIRELFIITILSFMFLDLVIEIIRIPYTIYVNEKYIAFKRILGVKILLINELETITTGLGIFRSPFYITFSTKNDRIKIANQIQSKNKLLNYIKDINPSVKISKRLY